MAEAGDVHLSQLERFISPVGDEEEKVCLGFLLFYWYWGGMIG